MAARATTRTATYPRHPEPARHRCPSCSVWTLTGLDSSVCGWVVVVDLVRLDPLTEMLALLAGLTTVELAADGRLERRGPREIALGQPRPVLAEHRCGRVNEGHPISTRKAKHPAPDIHGPNDQPPF